MIRPAPGRHATRFVVLAFGIFAAGTLAGRATVYQWVTGTPVWDLSVSIFTQIIVNTAVALLVVALAVHDRGAVVSAREKFVIAVASLGCIASFAISIEGNDWDEAWDWMTSFSAVLLILYALWVWMRQRPAQVSNHSDAANGQH